ncbi:MAG: flagellar brake protein [Gammaproteobacteria bacterium]|nr:flagellar brake protein [Gammaproteobacteria bacterium]
MFQLLRRIFPDKQLDAPSITEHWVEEREQIVALLMRSSINHVLFSVQLPEQQDTFSTALLGIYDEHGFIILDELTPEQGHRLLKAGMTIEISGRLDGVALNFETSLLEIREKNGIAYYKTRLPTSLNHRQQRNAYRIPSRSLGISFHGLRGKGIQQIVRGYVNDLSRNGVGIILAERVRLYQGEILSSCIISVPDEGEIAFSLEVCFCTKIPQREATRIGGKFKNIDHASLQKIRRSLNKIERVRARRKKDG